jgi:hypothetical protein
LHNLCMRWNSNINRQASLSKFCFKTCTGFWSRAYYVHHVWCDVWICFIPLWLSNHVLDTTWYNRTKMYFKMKKKDFFTEHAIETTALDTCKYHQHIRSQKYPRVLNALNVITRLRFFEFVVFGFVCVANLSNNKDQ